MKQEVIKIAATLIINELAPRLKKKNINIKDSPVTPEDIAALACFKYCEVFSTKDIRNMLDKRFNDRL